MKLPQLLLSAALIVAVIQPVLAQEDEETPPPEPAQVEFPPTSVPATPTPRPAATPTGPAAPGTVLFSDTFDDPAVGRLPRDSADPANYQRGYVGGEYALSQVDPKFTGYAFATIPGIYDDTSLAVDARILGDAKNRQIVLYCRIQPAGAFRGYRLLIFPDDGAMRLYRVDEGGQTPMTDFQFPSGLRKGNASNRYELGCAGPTIYMSVNGTRVASAGEGTYQSGVSQVAAGAVDATAEVRLDNLVVTQIPPEEPPTPGPYDGGWTGSTTDLGRANSFTVRNNAIVSITLDYNVEGDSCTSRTGTPPPTFTISPPAPIQNGAFSFTFSRETNPSFRGESGTFPGTTTFRVNGRFTSPTTATGDTEIDLEILTHQPPCKGVVKSNWTATK